MISLHEHHHFNIIKKFVIEQSGLDYYQNKDKNLGEHIAKRMQKYGSSDLLEYLAELQNENQVEFDELICLLTIGETYFFRQPEQFELLKTTVIPDLLKKNALRKSLRIWSAGCSVGAEVYSIAIMLKENFAKELIDWNVEILGTDINRHFLAQAKLGNYNDWSMRGLRAEYRDKYFNSTGEKQWQIVENLRKMVNFQYHNLVKNPFPSLVNNLIAFDLILCRNVLIYFSRETNLALLQSFRETLNQNGWYIPGYSEMDPDLYVNFHKVNADGYLLYQKSFEPVVPAAIQMAEVDSISVEPKIWQPYDMSAFSALPSTSVSTETIKPDLKANDELYELKNLLDQGLWDDGMNLCLKRIEENGLDAYAYFYASVICENLNDYETAIKYIKKALYIDSNFALAHYHYGLFNFKMESYALSLKAFSNAINLLTKLMLSGE